MYRHSAACKVDSFQTHVRGHAIGCTLDYFYFFSAFSRVTLLFYAKENRKASHVPFRSKVPSSESVRLAVVAAVCWEREVEMGLLSCFSGLPGTQPHSSKCWAEAN